MIRTISLADKGGVRKDADELLCEVGAQRRCADHEEVC